MHPGLIHLVNRITIGNKTSHPVLKEIWESTYVEVNVMMEGNRIQKFDSASQHGHHMQEVNRELNEFTDWLQKKLKGYLPFETGNTIIPIKLESSKLELQYAELGKQETYILVAHFVSQIHTLIGITGDYLLITEGDQAEKLIKGVVLETFPVKLNENFYISNYKMIQPVVCVKN